MNAVHIMIPGPANLRNATKDHPGSSSAKLAELRGREVCEAKSSLPVLTEKEGDGCVARSVMLTLEKWCKDLCWVVQAL